MHAMRDMDLKSIVEKDRVQKLQLMSTGQIEDVKSTAQYQQRASSMLSCLLFKHNSVLGFCQIALTHCWFEQIGVDAETLSGTEDCFSREGRRKKRASNVEVHYALAHFAFL